MLQYVQVMKAERQHVHARLEFWHQRRQPPCLAQNLHATGRVRLEQQARQLIALLERCGDL